MRVLNVAEKPSAANEIQSILSNRKSSKKQGKSQYNPIFEFKYKIFGQECDMVFTSVIGHLKSTDIKSPNNEWSACQPIDLFHVDIIKFVPDDKKKIEQQLKDEARRADVLILWLDCDKEGENIAFEVLDVCKSVKRTLRVWRARFSAIIPNAIKRACEDLKEPNEKDSIAVDARIEIDLRIGAAFTRFQTKYLKGKFTIDNGNNTPISYGPCQFPTLGFVVDRYLRIINFVPEEFWTITVQIEKLNPLDDKVTKVDFSWKRKRLFDYSSAFMFYEMILDRPTATVTDITKRENRFRPLPLTTIEMQKLASSKLRLSSDKTMALAEELYNKGLISYPRTETDSFEKGTDLKGLIRHQLGSNEWGRYAAKLLEGEFTEPKVGKNNDNSHPPIHPTAPGNGLDGDKKALYELIARRFLACCSQDSIFANTTVTIDIAGETFSETGSMLVRLGYLEVYKYDKRSEHSIPPFQQGETYTPSEIKLIDGKTTAPHLIKETELLSAMDRDKIGTDATMAQHIKTIQDRGYVEKIDNAFKPTILGTSLIVAYDLMGFEFSKPDLRAQIEADVAQISAGRKTKQQVLDDTINKYRNLFTLAMDNVACFDRAFSQHYDPYGSQITVAAPNFSKCGKCQAMMDLKLDGHKRILFCNSCKIVTPLPNNGEIRPSNHICPICKYQALEIQSSPDKRPYNVCPHCRLNHPAFVQDKSQPFPCFKCTFSSCPLATGSTFTNNNNNNNSNNNNNNYNSNAYKSNRVGTLQFHNNTTTTTTTSNTYNNNSNSSPAKPKRSYTRKASTPKTPSPAKYKKRPATTTSVKNGVKTYNVKKTT
ncbi:hypothetical protein CYY_000442 [Polysphondylium violaceum]|uniref:DNA topoisomerase n=1 Tax=Polysphondylium violaceum TaxID=133409 RepID=A0A8J4Q4P5_9MYCE|nr:hypothetical protein CYY_000442 [Polysphondylium violaceum]